jgi:hypothetical protein
VAKITIWGEPAHQEFFVSFERTPLVLADLRKELPKLKRELSKNWPVMYVGIQQPLIRRKNPIDPHAVVQTAKVGLEIFLAGSVAGAGKETGAQLVKTVTAWIKRHAYKPKRKPRKPAKKRNAKR